MNNETFLISWDMTGLEAIVCISEMARQETWQALIQDHTKENHKSRSSTVNELVNKITLRARYNSQRHYEIYLIDVDSTITDKDLKDFFEADPQAAADLIRSRGRQLYSDRIRGSEIKIT